MPPVRQGMLAGDYLLHFLGGSTTMSFETERLGIRRGHRFAPVQWVAADEGFVPLESS